MGKIKNPFPSFKSRQGGLTGPVKQAAPTRQQEREAASALLMAGVLRSLIDVQRSALVSIVAITQTTLPDTEKESLARKLWESVAPLSPYEAIREQGLLIVAGPLWGPVLVGWVKAGMPAGVLSGRIQSAIDGFLAENKMTLEMPGEGAGNGNR